MASVTEYLEKLQKLTQRNLDILQAINDAFYIDKSHLSVNVGNEQYTIPSFMHLENKINALQDNFNNLVYAPKTGEASFNFDGNSQTIELRGFTCTPQSIELKSPEYFSVENNHIFKDFLTPNPYVNFDLSSIPNDISKVCIKKVVAVSDLMKEDFKNSYISEKLVTYEQLYKKLSLYKNGEDYIEYETTKELPIRKSIGTGTYIIKSIDDHKILDDLTETYTLTISGELKYKLFDNVIEKYLQEGDELVTFDDSAKMRILEVRHNTNQLVIEVMNGDYLNLTPDTGDDTYVSDMSKLKFYSTIDTTKDRYINVPLEEDQYVAIFVSPLNNRMNIRAPWGTGVVLDVHALMNENGSNFKEYYDNNVHNIGDTLYELTTLSTNGITKYTKDEFDVFTGYKPNLKEEDLYVYQINKHLNDAPTIQKIRKLYEEKNSYKDELEEINRNIDRINTQISLVSFEDTSGVLAVYRSQLDEEIQKKNDVTYSINNVIKEIADAANNSETPIENAKFRIRGFYSVEKNGIIDEFADHINGIRVWYRYKNQSQETGNAQSIGSENIFSDWNEMPIIKRIRTPKMDNSKYSYEYKPDNSSINEPSFNQIDIPITQGEVVDVKLQVIWDFGFPFIETTSTWSEMISVKFPENLKTNIQILDIIEENNSEIEKYRFNNILKENGVISHVEDNVINGSHQYFHKSENILTDYVNEDRTNMSLQIKLKELTDQLAKLNAEIFGSTGEIKMYINYNNTNTDLIPNENSNVYIMDSGDNPQNISIVIENTSDKYIAKLHSLFPGDAHYFLNQFTNDTYKDYSEFKIHQEGNTESTQHLNQYIYFRNKNVWTGNNISQCAVSPYVKQEYSLCIDRKNSLGSQYQEINPKEKIVISLINDRKLTSENRTLQFTIKPSIYKEPITYNITFYYETTLSKITTSENINAVIKNNYTSQTNV